MKKKDIFDITVIFLAMFLSAIISNAQPNPVPTPTTTPASTMIRVRKGNALIALQDALTDENGKKVLIIDRNQVVELATEAGVILESQNEAVVRILDNKFVIGIETDAEAEILARKGGVKLRISDVEKLLIKVQSVDATRQITAESTFLNFKTVKDNFGKKFARSYFVIQVNIRNETLDKQFIVHNVAVVIDPNQCANARKLYERFDVDECFVLFDRYFIYPTPHLPIRKEEVIAAGKADLNRSNRSLGFRILKFSSDLGSILTGFNVLGPDGVKGINVLGTTVTSAANALLPNTADEKLENLRKAVNGENVVINSKDSKIFNIFVPTDRVFYKDSWSRYIRPANESGKDTFEMKLLLDTLLLSTATGVLVNNDAPKVEVKSDDDLENVKKRFNIVNRFEAAAKTSMTIRELLNALNTEVNAVGDSARVGNAKARIIKILKALKTKSSTAALITDFNETEAAKQTAAALFQIVANAVSNATDTGGDPILLERRTADILEALKTN